MLDSRIKVRIEHSSIIWSCNMIIDGIELKDNERTSCEVWTRVMGYYRPVSNFNVGKKGEFEQRVNFTEQKAFKNQQKD